VADELKTCANCGHSQAAGAFCEACGTKLPAAAAAAAATTPPPEPPAAAEPVSPPPPPPPAAAQPPYAAQPQYGAAPPPPGGYDTIVGKGFWSRFFDLSFSDYITPSVIRVLFIVIMVVIGLTVLGAIIAGFMVSAGTGVFALIGGIIYGFLSLLFSRVFLEVIMVFFHIHDNTRDIAKRKS
jgi:Domain of unknown function (DUF4282)